MDDKEFHEMLEKLHKLGLDDGDLGYTYWCNVIYELRKYRECYKLEQAKHK